MNRFQIIRLHWLQRCRCGVSLSTRQGLNKFGYEGPITLVPVMRPLDLLGWHPKRSLDNLYLDAWLWQSQNPLVYVGT